jgi:hypothetical protein
MTDVKTARAAALDVLANCHELLKGNPTDHMVLGICQAEAMAALTLATLAAIPTPAPAVARYVRCGEAHPAQDANCSLDIEHNAENTPHHTPGLMPWRSRPVTGTCGDPHPTRNVTWCQLEPHDERNRHYAQCGGGYEQW